MSPCLLDVVLPGSHSSLRQFCINRPNNPAGNSHHERASRHLHTLSQHGSCSHNTPGTDPHPIQQHTAHGNQAVISYSATVQDNSVPNRDSLAHGAGHAGVNVNDAAVLNVGLSTDDDGRHIPPQHGTVPDTGFLAEGYIAHDGGS